MLASAKAGQAKSLRIPFVCRKLSDSRAIDSNPMVNVLSAFARDDPFIGREPLHELTVYKEAQDHRAELNRSAAGVTPLPRLASDP